MRTSLKIAVLLVVTALAFTGCATGDATSDSPFKNLRAFAREDVAHALELAWKAPDPGAPYRARCYATLLAHLAEPDAVAMPAPEIKGLVSAFELGVELKTRVTDRGPLVPEAVQADCGYLKDEVLRFMVRGGAKMLPGGGAIGSVLGR